MLTHDAGASHPEQPSRLQAIVSEFQQRGLLERLTVIEATDADAATLRQVHDADYLALAHREITTGRRGLSTGDTAVGPGSWSAAVRAAGAGVAAVDAVIAGTVRNAFVCCRPPGHHASAARGMGFCILNNAAIAARHAQQAGAVRRVLIVDWDVHHGNGTQNVFYEDDSVLYFSTHQWPWYPGSGTPRETGRGPGRGFTLNVPLSAGDGDDEVLAAFEGELRPAARAFRPEFVIVSAGFDSRVGDPLGWLRVSDDGFARLTRLAMDLADQFAGGRVVSFLEGGYALNGLAAAAVAHVQTLMG